MPFWFEREAAERDDLLRFVREERLVLLFGSPAFDVERGRVARAYNSAYLVSADGAVLGRYDKRHLVPFGEYVPLSSLLFFVDKLVEGIADFSPGAGPTVFPVGTARIGALICYEVIFPELTRRAAADGATVMATITNDAWYGRSAAPYQHFDMVVFRAVENRIPFARAANTGVSGFIDAGGRVLSASDLFVPAARAAALAPRTRTTFYTRYGDVFAWLCVGATAALFAREIRRARGGSDATRRATMPSHRLDRKETRP
jgi:apolipoprotein N-acyltransferase